MAAALRGDHPGESTMTRRERLRRVAILCCTCARNLAYYRAGWHQGDIVFDSTSNIERTINSNFLDMAVLEWCKLFTSNEKHAWRKIVSDKDRFQAGLLAHLGIEEAKFEASRTELRTYRNKFLAHLDSHKIMRVPLMDTVKNSVIYYHGYLLQHENDGTTFDDEPSDLAAYYRDREDEGREFYGC